MRARGQHSEEGAVVMSIDKRSDTAAEAFAGVGDGATSFTSNFGGAGFPKAQSARAMGRSIANLEVV